MIQTINDYLAPLGLTVGQLIGAAATVIASFFAARFGASESKRQFGEKSRLEKLVAAGELLVTLQDFERTLQETIWDIQNSESSDGHAGQAHMSFSHVELGKKSHEQAAILGAAIVEDVILLLTKFSRAQSSASSAFEFVDGDEAQNEVLGWSAALLLEAHALMNRISERAGLKISSKPSMEVTKLRELAGGRGKDDKYTTFTKRKGAA
jgi:hypothetical protein